MKLAENTQCSRFLFCFSFFFSLSSLLELFQHHRIRISLSCKQLRLREHNFIERVEPSVERILFLHFVYFFFFFSCSFPPIFSSSARLLLPFFFCYILSLEWHSSINGSIIQCVKTFSIVTHYRTVGRFRFFSALSLMRRSLPPFCSCSPIIISFLFPILFWQVCCGRCSKATACVFFFVILRKYSEKINNRAKKKHIKPV